MILFRLENSEPFGSDEMANPADPTLDNFFKALNDPTFSPNYHSVNYLMANIFCPDTGVLPCVGITDYGPQFNGAGDVAGLFTQIFSSFPDFTLTPIPPRLYSGDGLTIGVQGTLGGTQAADWFSKGHKHYSPPISGITPDKIHLMKVPACSVFTVNAGNQITKWALYLDRYRMARQLTPAP
jgi:hypothetical protein